MDTSSLPFSVADAAVSRRGLLAGAGALAALALTGCNSSAQDAPADQPASSSFSYVDGRGKKIELPTRPTVVVAQSSAAAALWDAGFKVKGAYGELKQTNGRLGFQAGNLELDQVTVIGTTYGEFNVEKYAAMGPQLLVDLSFDPKTLWYVGEDILPKVEPLAPTLGVEMFDRDLLQIIGSFMDLAEQLGADRSAPDIAAAKTAFESEVVKVTAAPKGLTALGVSRDADKVYIANAAQHPDFAYLRKLGVTFVDHRGKAADYFTEISYEELDHFSGDVIFDDIRSPNAKADAQATWKALPAVKAGQVFDWKAAAPYSYAANVSVFAEFAKALTESKKVA